LTSPRFGLETERSGRAGSRTDSRRSSVWKRRCRPGTLTSQWWRKRRCERAKGRIEIPVPVECESDEDARCGRLSYDPSHAERRRWRAFGSSAGNTRPRSERPHADGSLNRTVNRKFLGYFQIRKGPNKVRIRGIPQPFADAIKLFIKEQSNPMPVNFYPFLAAPLLGLALTLLL